MSDVLVCNQNWNGVNNGTFRWHNNTGGTVTISQNGNATWPFTLPSPIVLNKNVKEDCGLIGTPGTYTYNVSPCTNLGNPRNVIIT